MGVLEKNLAFAGFLTLLGVLYIWNTHQAAEKARTETSLRNELRDLKSEYLTLNARISVARQQTSILQMADSLGLHVPAEPPYLLPLPAAQ
jgi:hypothetical protein